MAAAEAEVVVVAAAEEERRSSSAFLRSKDIKNPFRQLETASP